ncbi:hypothetical protein LEMLEM_LOCUS22455 [Lemmus lemmus]
MPGGLGAAVGSKGGGRDTGVRKCEWLPEAEVWKWTLHRVP